jgi:hypothetical protein
VSGLALLCGGGCAFFNPYTRAGSHMLSHYDGNVKFCWAPVGAPSEKGSCQDERPARQDLLQCIEQLRSHASIRTTEHDADSALASCMSDSGWQRIWIEGAILWGMDP